MTIWFRKLEYYGVKAKNQQRFTRYLNNCNQFISCSDFAPIEYVVPQGSIIRVLLFLYRDCSLSMYAKVSEKLAFPTP